MLCKRKKLLQHIPDFTAEKYLLFCRHLRIVAPEVALPGRTTPILVTLKIVDTRRRDAANVTLKLIADGAETHSRPLVQMTLPIQGKKRLTACLLFVQFKYIKSLSVKVFSFSGAQTHVCR